MRIRWHLQLAFAAVAAGSAAHAQLYVSQGSTVGEYDATTGAAINANFITGLSAPVGLALGAPFRPLHAPRADPEQCAAVVLR